MGFKYTAVILSMDDRAQVCLRKRFIGWQRGFFFVVSPFESRPKLAPSKLLTDEIQNQLLANRAFWRVVHRGLPMVFVWH